jgi:hypothetical protein
MTVTTNIDEFTRRMEQRAQKMERARTAATREASTHVRQRIESRTQSVTGGDMALSRARGGRGAPTRLRIRETVKAGEPSTATLKAQGPWPLIESSLPAHQIPKTLRGRGRTRKVLLIPGIGFRRRVQHPGVRRGPGPWKRGSTEGLRGVHEIYQRAVREAIR